jgi:hypothetical protein
MAAIRAQVERQQGRLQAVLAGWQLVGTLGRQNRYQILGRSRGQLRSVRAP